jgi:hypothetical protein
MHVNHASRAHGGVIDAEDTSYRYAIRHSQPILTPLHHEWDRSGIPGH